MNGPPAARASNQVEDWITSGEPETQEPRESGDEYAFFDYCIEYLRSLGVRPRNARRMVFTLYAEFQAQEDVAMGFRAWFITYADPTGEVAVNNVLRQQVRREAA